MDKPTAAPVKRLIIERTPVPTTQLIKTCITFCLGFAIGTFITQYTREETVAAVIPKPKEVKVPETNVVSKPLCINILNKNSTSSLRVPRSTPGSAVINDMKRYVCSSYGPRLGNLMFLYASNYGVAFDNNMTLALTNHDYIQEPFLIPKPFKLRHELCRRGTRSFTQRRPRYFEKFYIPKTGDIRLSGYLQSWKYFRNSFEDLRKQFTFRPKYANEASEKLKQLVKQEFPDKDPKSVTTVGIHIRRGDYVAEKRPIADFAFIESAKGYFLKNFTNVLFIVATNVDKEAKTWCTNNVINGTGKSVFSGFNHRFVDMAMLSMCDHIIISTGTYGWWAAFLNKGTVIHYDWIPPNHYKFNREDYILPSWVGIKSTKKYKATRN